MTDFSDLESLFTAVDAVLTRHRHLWQVRAFHHRELPWKTSHTSLCSALEALDEVSIGELEQCRATMLDWLAPWLRRESGERDMFTLPDRLPALPRRAVTAPPRLETGIGGRKWQQVQALAATLPDEQRPLLEWCSGKGHLGRLLALVDGRTVTSLERDEALCHSGRQLAAAVDARQQFVTADALAESSRRWLPDNGQAVALHACGDLHTQLMRYWAASDCQRLTVAPCCFHLTDDTLYRPLSTPGAGSTLQLERVDLQWAVRQLVTGGAGVQRRRWVELTWRLAFDEWQRHTRREDTYLPLPSFPKGLLSGSFSHFCEWAAAKKDLAAKRHLDEAYWLALGAQRARLVRLMELAGRPFQRLLELWLVLDRALFLQQYGARVRMGTFCDYRLTPRNLVIDVVKH